MDKKEKFRKVTDWKMSDSVLLWILLSFIVLAQGSIGYSVSDKTIVDIFAVSFIPVLMFIALGIGLVNEREVHWEKIK